MMVFRYLDGDDYEAWKVIDDAWHTDSAPEGTVNLRDIAGEYLDWYFVPVAPCEHDRLSAHTVHRGELRDGPCDPNMCGSSIHWFTCEGAGLEAPE